MVSGDPLDLYAVPGLPAGRLMKRCPDYNARRRPDETRGDDRMGALWYGLLARSSRKRHGSAPSPPANSHLTYQY